MSDERFYLGDDGVIFDRKNWRNNGFGWCCDDALESQNDARISILWGRLNKLFKEDLLPPRLRMEDNPIFDRAVSSMCDVLHAVGIAHLAEKDASDQCAEKADKKPDERDVSNLTSFNLFFEDAAKIMNDLYGSIPPEVSQALRRAILNIAGCVFQKKGKELLCEIESASIVDGSLRLPGYVASKGDRSAEIEAGHKIAGRIRAIQKNPTKYGKYTVAFAEKCQHLFDLEKYDRMIADEAENVATIKDTELEDSMYEL
jgi:hypothetical protein